MPVVDFVFVVAKLAQRACVVSVDHREPRSIERPFRLLIAADDLADKQDVEIVLVLRANHREVVPRYGRVVPQFEGVQRCVGRNKLVGVARDSAESELRESTNVARPAFAQVGDEVRAEREVGHLTLEAAEQSGLSQSCAGRSEEDDITYALAQRIVINDGTLDD